jgi:hypothetical protein
MTGRVGDLVASAAVVFLDLQWHVMSPNDPFGLIRVYEVWPFLKL